MLYITYINTNVYKNNKICHFLFLLKHDHKNKMSVMNKNYIFLYFVICIISIIVSIVIIILVSTYLVPPPRLLTSATYTHAAYTHIHPPQVHINLCSLLPIPYSLLPIPCYLLPDSRSLHPISISWPDRTPPPLATLMT